MEENDDTDVNFDTGSEVDSDDDGDVSMQDANPPGQTTSHVIEPDSSSDSDMNELLALLDSDSEIECEDDVDIFDDGVSEDSQISSSDDSDSSADSDAALDFKYVDKGSDTWDGEPEAVVSDALNTEGENIPGPGIGNRKIQGAASPVGEYEDVKLANLKQQNKSGLNLLGQPSKTFMFGKCSLGKLPITRRAQKVASYRSELRETQERKLRLQEELKDIEEELQEDQTRLESAQ